MDANDKKKKFVMAVQDYINSSCKDGKISGDVGLKIKELLLNTNSKIDKNNYCQSLIEVFTDEFVQNNMEELIKITGINMEIIESMLENIKASISTGLSWSDTIKNVASFYYKKIGYLDKAAFSIVMIMLLKYYFNISSPLISDWIFNVGATAAATFSYFGGKKVKRDKAKAGKKIKKYETSNLHEILSGVNKKLANKFSNITVKFDEQIKDEEIEQLEYDYGLNYYSISKYEIKDNMWHVSKKRFDKVKSFLTCYGTPTKIIEKRGSIQCSDFLRDSNNEYTNDYDLTEDERVYYDKVYKISSMRKYVYEYVSEFLKSNRRLENFFVSDNNKSEIEMLNKEINKMRETYIYYLLILYKKMKKSTRVSKKGIENFVYELSQKNYLGKDLDPVDIKDIYFTSEDLNFSDELISDVYDFIAGKREQRGKLSHIPTIYCVLRGPFGKKGNNEEIKFALFPHKTLSAVASINPTFAIPVAYKYNLNYDFQESDEPYLYKQLLKMLKTNTD